MLWIRTMLTADEEELAKLCNKCLKDDDACPVGLLSVVPCPFPNRSCGDIRPGDWEEVTEDDDF